MHYEELIGKYITITGVFDSRYITVEGILKKVSDTHLVLDEPDQKGRTYVNKKLHVIVLNVREP